MSTATAIERIRVSANIYQFRKQRGWTQQELAKRLNTTQSVVSRWEQPVADMTLNTLEKLANVFEVSIGDFFNQPIKKRNEAE